MHIALKKHNLIEYTRFHPCIYDTRVTDVKWKEEENMNEGYVHKTWVDRSRQLFAWDFLRQA